MTPDIKVWWTFEELMEYLGHTNHNSTEVWCTRHGIKPIRHYRVKDILKARPPKPLGSKEPLK
jgi:hypothetical protein